MDPVQRMAGDLLLDEAVLKAFDLWDLVPSSREGIRAGMDLQRLAMLLSIAEQQQHPIYVGERALLNWLSGDLG